MATLLKVLNNLVDIKSAGGVLHFASELKTTFAQHGLLRTTLRLVLRRLCIMAKRRRRKRQWTLTAMATSISTDIDRTSDQDIQEIVLTTNLTPLKCLAFKTPFQALLAELG